MHHFAKPSQAKPTALPVNPWQITVVVSSTNTAGAEAAAAATERRLRRHIIETSVAKRRVSDHQ